MAGSAELVGREKELRVLRERLARSAAGNGGLLLVAGEAGVGKTTLAERALIDSAPIVLRGIVSDRGRTPYAPIVSALRAYGRIAPEALAGYGRLARHLCVLLPELGPAPPGIVDHLLLAETVIESFAGIASRQPAAVFFDDLQWVDEATLDLLPSLAASVESQPLLFLTAYRSDDVTRAHPLRRMRAELRRGGRLEELVLAPLERDQVTALVSRIVERRAGPRLVERIFERTEGVPFLVEELAAALAAGGGLEEHADAVELPAGHDVPFPDSVRETVLLRTDRLSPAGVRALEVASVAGEPVDLALVADLAGDAGVEEAIEARLLVEADDGVAAFRHALVREAVYSEIPWTRRRVHHRHVAEHLEWTGAPPQLVAEHWLGAGEPERARPKLLAAADAFAPCMPIATPCVWAGARSTCGPRGRTERGGSSRSSASVGAPS